MINGCWKACYEPDDTSGKVFAADAIISNPPAFAHVHCAEALGIPLLLTFSELFRPHIHRTATNCHVSDAMESNNSISPSTRQC